jgi:protoheme IX farnesyltransferase
MSVRARDAVRAYATLTKPRIILLLLVTTVPAMVLADRGVPSLWLIAATLAGGTIAAGGANAINQYLDRDIDEIMSRTRGRPLPAHAIEPARALLFGLGLAVASFAFLTLTVNLLSAVLAASAIAFYVFVYTVWLKRRSPQNIVIGGAAGAVPVLVGWAAVTGTVGWPAVVLFAIVFMWTPPHFWALSLRYQGDYAAAGVPMLPVVAGWERTARDIALYTVVLVGTTLLLVPVGHMGPLYVVSALVLGGGFVLAAVRLLRDASTATAMRMFRFSIAYLSLLFLAVALDTLVRFGP